jgi:hypothetical protein
MPTTHHVRALPSAAMLCCLTNHVSCMLMIEKHESKIDQSTDARLFNLRDRCFSLAGWKKISITWDANICWKKNA